MIEKFRDLSLESKILLLVVLAAGFFASIIFLSSLIRSDSTTLEEEKPSSITEQTETMPETTEAPNISPTPTIIDSVEDYVEEGYGEEDFPEGLIDYSLEIDENHYRVASQFILDVCNKNINETYDEIFTNKASQEKYMNTINQYEDLKYSDVYNEISCEYFSDSINEYSETEYSLTIELFVNMSSEIDFLTRETVVKYAIDTVKEDNNYYVVKARLVNPELYND